MNELFTIAFNLIVCHLIGDYVLLSDFIAKTKGENFYHLIIHCVLYVVPFVCVGVYTPLLLFIFVTHLGIDYFKTGEKLDYMIDQILHYVVLIFVAVYMMV